MAHVNGSEPVIGFAGWRELWEAWDGCAPAVLDLARRPGVVAVAELGGGSTPICAHPLWRPRLERTVVDVNPAALAAAPDDVETIQADLSAPLDIEARFDLVFSKMLAQRIADPGQFHRNCRAMLRPGGRAVHFFATVTTLPFAVSRASPTRLGRAAVRVVRPDRARADALPSHFRWCTGPTRQARERLRSAGFEIERYVGAFGHDYYRPFPALARAERWKARQLAAHPTPWLTSYAWVTLRRPG
jgi:SAM-dependent methyltransferase